MSTGRKLTLAHANPAGDSRQVVPIAPDRGGYVAPPGYGAYGPSTGYGGGYAGGGGPGPGAGGQEDDLLVLFKKLWRQKWIVALAMLLGLVVAFFAMSTMPRTYKSSAVMMVEDSSPAFLDNRSVRAIVSPYDDRSINSQIDLLMSRDLAEEVIRHLYLQRFEEFDPTLREDTWRDRLWSKIVEIAGGDGASVLSSKELPSDETAPEVVTSTGGDGAATQDTAGTAGSTDLQLGTQAGAIPSPQGLPKSDVPNAVVRSFLSRLDVQHKPRTKIIEISYKSVLPELTSAIPNALAEIYIRNQTEAKFDESRRTTDWLQSEIDELRAKVRKEENEIEELRQASGLINTGGGTITGQQISEINAELIKARTVTAQARARLDQVKGMVASGGVVAAGEMVGSPMILTLQEQKGDIERRKAELGVQYGAKHPKIINLEAELQDVDAQLQSEASKIVSGLEGDLSVARAQENSLASALQSLETKAGSSGRDEVKIRQLERVTEASRSQLNDLLGRLSEAKSQEDRDILKADVRVISYADVPERPASPKPSLILPMALVVSALLGIGLALAREQMEPGFLSGQQIEQEFGVPTIALIPSTNRFSNLGGEPDILQEPRSAFAESMRTIAASIRLFDIDNPPRSVLVTSSEPSEGKTTTAISVARLQALAGLKVIIVDTDIRKPAVHERLAVRRAPGLVEVLDGKHTLDEVVIEDEKTGLHVIPVGVPMSTDILSLDAMQELVDYLSEHYDLVILDSAPILLVSDARVLPAVADMTIFTCRWRSTRREVVRLAMKKLAESGARLGGVVLSRVDVSRHSKYAYGDSGIYTGKNKKYYANSNS